VLLAVGVYHSLTIKTKVSATIIEDTTVIARKHFIRFLEPVESLLRIGRGWGKNGLLQEVEDRQLSQILAPLLSTYKHISSVMIADSSGKDYLLKRDGQGWITRSSQGDKPRRSAKFTRWSQDYHVSLQSWDEEIDFNPRTRPWFTEVIARQPGQINWTDPYLFASGQVGITASISWLSANKGFRVMAFDLLQAELIQFLSQIPIGDQGHIVLLEPDGSIIVDHLPQKVTVDTSHDPVLKALDIWRTGKGQQKSVFEFQLGGQTWWASLTSMRRDKLTPWMLVLLPENSIYDTVFKSWLFIGGIVLAVLGVAVLSSLLLVNKYSHQLRDLPRQKVSDLNMENELRALIAAGESATLEFKSTMRVNLKSGKKGKEIELAWLKSVVALMNSDGGIVLIGVDDDGNILGVKADKFRSEDRLRLHFKSLINQHIGPEFSHFINLKTVLIDESMVLIIECERVRKPVFLKVGKNEDFLVRSGPSSMKLTMSQMVKYLEEHY